MFGFQIRTPSPEFGPTILSHSRLTIPRLSNKQMKEASNSRHRLILVSIAAAAAAAAVEIVAVYPRIVTARTKPTAR